MSWYQASIFLEKTSVDFKVKIHIEQTFKHPVALLHITAIKNTANRIRDAKKEGMKVIDVDGSYLARKHQQLQVDGVNVAPLGVPPIPPSGWNAVSESNFM